MEQRQQRRKGHGRFPPATCEGSADGHEQAWAKNHRHQLSPSPVPMLCVWAKNLPQTRVLCVPRKGTVRGLVASPRCLPRDRGQLASRPCAARPASGEWGLHARVQAWSDFLARAWADFLGGERCLPAPRSWTACLASVGSLPHDCLLHAPREPGLHPCPRACAAHSLPRAGELCLFLASG